ncbi:MAG: alpha/beta fold hydrolase [Planctomycetes bacterium]|nr:alpha/beta fold hydrolase [Planctomycetota bacterium]
MLPHEFRNAAGERLAHSAHPGAPGCDDLVVIGHGLTSDKDRPWSERLSAELERRGIASLRIAFSGNGESEGRFADSNITKEIADLGSVLDTLSGRRIAYVGHSMGAAVGLLRAATDPRIRVLVSLAGIAHTAAFAERLLGHLRPGDPILGKAHCPLSMDLVNDLEAIDSVCPTAAAVAVPWLVVHGDADAIVPVQDSIDLAAGTVAELRVLRGVDHSFTTTGALDALVATVVPWLAAALDRARGGADQRSPSVS